MNEGMGQIMTREEIKDFCDMKAQLEPENEDIFKAIVEALEQEPRKGHWIGQKKIGFGKWKECIVPLKDGFVTDSCSCSECGDWLTGSDEYQCSGNFCPNCGADMREVEE